jgi:hypothetical protein
MKLYTLLLIVAGAAGAVYAKSDFPSAAARGATLEAAEQRIQDRTFKHAVVPAKMVVPFTAKMPEIAAEEPVAAVGLTGYDLLNALAAQLNPTGVLMLGDNAVILFGEKKMKVGDVVDIAFDKRTYSVELTDITRTSFTIRYNNQQVTRSIKSSKAP